VRGAATPPEPIPKDQLWLGFSIISESLAENQRKKDYQMLRFKRTTIKVDNKETKGYAGFNSILVRLKAVERQFIQTGAR
jgi:hypothetical protein